MDITFAYFDEYGPPAVLKTTSELCPPLGSDEILVEIAAAGVNPYDLKLRAGEFSAHGSQGRQRIGIDGAGTVIRVGAEVADWPVGQRVLVRNKVGTYASHIAVKGLNLVKLPTTVTFEEAAAIGTPAGTAFQALKSLNVSAEDSVLIHGGSGAVGQAAIQFARTLGALRIYATTSANRVEKVRALGAEPVVYGDKLMKRLEQISAISPFTVILDAAGTEDALRSVKLLSHPSRWATIVQGKAADRLRLRSFDGGSSTPLSRDERRLRKEGVHEALRLIGESKFHVEVGQTFPLTHACQAHEFAECSGTSGRAVVVPEPRDVESLSEGPQ